MPWMNRKVLSQIPQSLAQIFAEEYLCNPRVISLISEKKVREGSLKIKYRCVSHGKIFSEK
jgi:hypothetical protein